MVRRGSPPDVLAGDLVTLRRWRAQDAEELMAALDRSFPELNEWMDWAQDRPTLGATRRVIAQATAAFDAGTEWGYGLVETSTGEIVGGAGLHDRVEPGALEIGYWVRSDRTGRGYATAAAQLLTATAFAVFPESSWVELHADVANVASNRVAEKLGYRLDRREDREILAAGHTGQGHVWVMTDVT